MISSEEKRKEENGADALSLSRETPHPHVPSLRRSAEQGTAFCPQCLAFYGGGGRVTVV